jgi:hypothetical protein
MGILPSSSDGDACLAAGHNANFSHAAKPEMLWAASTKVNARQEAKTIADIA